jgi:hypothetical protein
VTPGSSEGSSSRLPWLAISLLLALQLGRFSAYEYLLDDAWISFRVARNWVEAGIPTFDLTRPPVEGMTNLLWTALVAIFLAILPDLSPTVPARVMGALCLAGTVYTSAGLVVRHLSRSDTPEAARRGGWVTGGLLAASGTLAFYAMSGLETALWTWLFALVLERMEAWWAGDQAAGWHMGVLMGLLATCRPEGVLVGCLCLILPLAAGSMAQGRSGPGPRDWVRAGLPFLLIVGLLQAFRWHTYQALVPNTFFAKAPVLDAGFAYLGRFLLPGLGGIGLIAGWPAARRTGFGRGLAVLILALVVAAVGSGGDWMPGYRRLSLAVVGLAVLSGLSCGPILVLQRAATSTIQRCALAGGLAWLGGSGWMAIQGSDSVHLDQDLFADLGTRVRASQVERVALVDIGQFGWYFPGSIYDLAGLTDRHLARLPGSHGTKEWDEAYFRQQAPDLVLVVSATPITDPLRQEPSPRPFEVGVLRSILDHQGYTLRHTRPDGGGAHMLVFQRAGIELSDELWGSPPTRDLRDLYLELLGKREH